MLVNLLDLREIPLLSKNVPQINWVIVFDAQIPSKTDSQLTIR